MEQEQEREAPMAGLSLERPYKNDDGHPIPVLFDIAPDGVLHYESKQTPTQLLGSNLNRILHERGQDFFERLKDGALDSATVPSANLQEPAASPNDGVEPDNPGHIMTKDELFKLKTQILPQLFTAAGEMNLAKDLLSSILSIENAPSTSLPSILNSNLTSETAQTDSLPTLSASLVTKPPPIVSMQAFDTQVAIGGKDEALRKAAGLFRSAANRMERGRVQAEKYWVDALTIRRANWGLVPAPLPLGSPTGKGADRTSKDFMISYGLEESPPGYRGKALARIGYGGWENDSLVFPSRSNVRLRVSIGTPDASGNIIYSHNSLHAPPTDYKSSLDDLLKNAQREVIEDEIFSILVREAGTFPTASARVSERLVLIDVTQGMELKFELIDEVIFTLGTSISQHPLNQARSDFIYHYLLTLLLRRHAHAKGRRLGAVGSSHSSNPIPASSQTNLPILQPIIDQLQYQVFCLRIHAQLNIVRLALAATGIPAALRFDPVGEVGAQLIKIPVESEMRSLGGVSTLRVDNRHNLRLTMVSPSVLTAHLPQATISISSLPQLSELLSDEVERFFLERICEVGRRICKDMGGIWFVDLNRCVGRWEGCVLNFRLTFGENFKIMCTATRLSRSNPKHPIVETYKTSKVQQGLMNWVQSVLGAALTE
ncbi:hypothetical protein D9757_002750 [Collybiopsis confluens]|uniref:Mediator of RNA polymerase II transcription subunit 17 n=1 Tax=Collybiopsis confluens TaxID=2823264 RepID=A0A8H5HWF0_9AGAR|nr:hypothetical protein D9757_002750 [Collybiopsis confluens]